MTRALREQLLDGVVDIGPVGHLVLGGIPDADLGVVGDRLRLAVRLCSS